MKKSQAIFIIKTVERCNINCTYCYFFNKADQSYKKHPPLISLPTMVDVAQFIAQGCKEMALNSLIIYFHGGEPLMQKRRHFELFCELLTAYIPKETKMAFSIQTNGLLLTEKWLDLLAKYNVHLSISLDGPKTIHDAYRIDHAGRGTYDRLLNKISLVNNHSTYQHKGFSVLSVINKDLSAQKAYQFFFEKLQLTNVDFLIPDNTHDDKLHIPPGTLGIFLSELFKIWIKDESQTRSIRLFESITDKFLNKPSQIYGHGPSARQGCLPLITIASSGGLSPMDDLRSTDVNLMNTDHHVSSTTLKKVLCHKNFKKIELDLNTLPDACNACIWKNICHGGSLVNRYSEKNGFNNPSVFCSDLKQLYRTMCISLLEGGMAVNDVLGRVSSENSN